VVFMVKTLNLPLRVYEDLESVSEELTLMAKKPISPSMTVNLLIEVYRAHMSNPCALDTFSQQMQTLNLMSPDEFDRYWDEPASTGRSKNKTKNGNPKKGSQ
jgi:hypothetical protein